MRSGELDLLRDEIRRGNRRTVLAVIGAALLIGAAVIIALGEALALGEAPPPMLWGAPVWSWIFGVAGACSALAAVWPVGGRER